MIAPIVRVVCSRPSVCAAIRSANADRIADVEIDHWEMSRTEDVSRVLSAVLTCGPPTPGRARVRRDISGCATASRSRGRLRTCSACQGCTGISSRSPSRIRSGHSPVTRHSRAPTGISPSRTCELCSGPYASCSSTEKPGRERQLGWNGCPSTTRCSHSQSLSGHSLEWPFCPARDSANDAALCASSEAKYAPCGTASPVISRAGSSYDTRSSRTAVTYAEVAYGSATGPCSRRPSDSRSTPGPRSAIHGSGSWASARHSRVSTAARAPGSSAVYRDTRSGRTTASSSATSASTVGGRCTGGLLSLRAGRHDGGVTTDILIVSRPNRP